jgi:hypothetical protein
MEDHVRRSFVAAAVLLPVVCGVLAAPQAAGGAPQAAGGAPQAAGGAPQAAGGAPASSTSTATSAWRFGWDNEGSSSDPASDLYRGPAGDSEPESVAMNALPASRRREHMRPTVYFIYAVHGGGRNGTPSR